MAVVRVRSTKRREDHLEVDDLGNLEVAVAATVPTGVSGPTTGGSAATGGQATELEVGSTAAAAANNQTLAGAANKRTYITGFFVDGLGATAAGNIAVTVTGLTNTLTFNVAIPAGAAVALTRFYMPFPRAIPASADNTAIVVNVPTYGAGNLTASAGAFGYQI